jgi:hypothetical protein
MYYSCNSCIDLSHCCSCKKCDNSDECDPSVPKQCCVHKIAAGIDRLLSDADTDVDISCRNGKSAPCVMPPPNDPCAGQPCQNGAKCGVEYAANLEECKQQVRTSIQHL